MKRYFLPILLGTALLWGCASKEETLMKEGRALLDAGEYVQAVNCFDHALEVHGNGRIRALELDILKYRAEAEFKAGDYHAAGHTYDILISAEGRKSNYLYMQAIIHARMAEDDAIAQIEEAQRYLQEADKGDAKMERLAAMEIAKAYEAVYENKPEEQYLTQAEEILNGVIRERGQKEPQSLGLLGNIRFKRQDYAGAKEAFEEALALFNERNTTKLGESLLKDLRFSQAVCYEYLQDYPKALELFNDYVVRFGEDEKAAHEIAFLQSRIHP